MKQIHPDTLLTERELRPAMAEYLGLNYSLATLRSWRHRGGPHSIPFIKPDGMGRVYYRWGTIVDHIAMRSNEKTQYRRCKHQTHIAA